MTQPSPATSLPRHHAMSLAVFNAARRSHGLAPVPELPRTTGTTNTYRMKSPHVSGVIQADSTSEAIAAFCERTGVSAIDVRAVLL